MNTENQTEPENKKRRSSRKSYDVKDLDNLIKKHREEIQRHNEMIKELKKQKDDFKIKQLQEAFDLILKEAKNDKATYNNLLSMFKKINKEDVFKNIIESKED